MKNLVRILILPLLLSSCAIFTEKQTAGKFPVYGNWCGLDHPKKGTNPVAIDKTDLACQHHDKCYEVNGYLNKNCDENLIAELKTFIPNNQTEAIIRKAIISYFKNSPKL